MQTYSLYELNEYIRRVIALNFEEPIWINCEISQVREARGQVYLELVQHDEEKDTIIAQGNAAIWYKSYLFLKNKLKDLLPSILKEGVHVLIKVRVDFHERYGLKLSVEDIDPSYTMGQLEIQRQKILERLRTEGVMELNQTVPLPVVLQRIAIISSKSAAGYKDFVHQIQDNIYGYFFRLRLFHCAVQGMHMERDICNALDEIKADKDSYDCIIIIRGGGSKLDLGGFDNFNIGYKIATHPLPILTGIGHEIDSTVADVVAHRTLKTPTAVADFLLERNGQFEAEILEQGSWIHQLTKQHIKNADLSIQYSLQILQHKPKEISRYQNNDLDNIFAQIQTESKYAIQNNKDSLSNLSKLIAIADPVNILKKGFSITTQGDKIIRSAKDVDKNEILTVQYADGNIDTQPIKK